MNNLIKKENIYIFTNILSIIICLLIIPFILYNDVITNHDSNYVFQYTYNNNWFVSGRIVCRFLVSFFYVFIPEIFNIHPNDVSSIIVPVFTSIFMCITSYFCLKLYYLFDNKNKFIIKNHDFFILFPAIYVIIAFIPTINEGLDMFYLSGIFETTVFYDDLFNIMFFIIFIYFIVSSFFAVKSKSVNILYYVNAFLLGISYEPIAFTSCLFYVLTSVYILGIYIKNRSLSGIAQAKHLFLIGIPLLIGSFLHFSLSNYSDEQIIEYSNHITDQIAYIPSYFIKFYKGLFNSVILDNIVLIAIILILSLVLFCLKDNEKKNHKVIMLSMFLLISCITYFILLLIPGYCTVYPYDFWYSHPPFRIIFYKILLLIILVHLGYLVSERKIFSKIIKIILPILLYLLICINYQELNREYKTERETINDIRRIIYMSDKMTSLYESLDGIALLPISWYHKYSTYKFIFRPRCYDAEKRIKNEMKDIINNEFNEKKSRLYTEAEENDYLLYLYYTYKYNPEGIIWVDDNTAFSEFEKRGGYFPKTS